MSTSLSAHNGCVSMFAKDPHWKNQKHWGAGCGVEAAMANIRRNNKDDDARGNNDDGDKQQRTNRRANNNKPRLPKLKVERREKEFLALATNSGGESRPSSTTKDQQQQPTLLMMPSSSAVPQVEDQQQPQEEWVVLGVTASDSGDGFVLLGPNDDYGDEANGAENGDVHLSYAQAADLTMGWEVSGDEPNAGKSSSPLLLSPSVQVMNHNGNSHNKKSRRKKKKAAMVVVYNANYSNVDNDYGDGGETKEQDPQDECTGTIGLDSSGSFAKHYYATKSHGEEMYQRRKADKAKRKASNKNNSNNAQ